MSLTPPPDYTNAIICGCVGICSALIIVSLKGDYSATVGDNIHKLPHGGSYKDGTKSVVYAGRLFNGRSHLDPEGGSSFSAFLVVWALIFLIYASYKCAGRGRCFHYHNCDFHPAQ
ncbi:triple gene block 2 [Pomes virus Greece]|nr:triple gene block 2 [Pomes virus Greece]